MTRNGEYTPMNRSGMLDCPSPFLQMSFETTTSFLTRACFEGKVRTDMFYIVFVSRGLALKNSPRPRQVYGEFEMKTICGLIVHEI